MTDHIVAGTGSRGLQTADPDVKNIAAAIVANALIDLREQHGTRLTIMSGLAEGFDKLLALAALRFKLRLWAAVPNRGYGAHYWGRASLTGENRLPEFEDILSQAWRVTYVMEEIHADEFLVWDPTSKGTDHCFKAIKRAGKPYKILSDQPAQLPLRSTT